MKTLIHLLYRVIKKIFLDLLYCIFYSDSREHKIGFYLIPITTVLELQYYSNKTKRFMISIHYTSISMNFPRFITEKLQVQDSIVIGVKADFTPSKIAIKIQGVHGLHFLIALCIWVTIFTITTFKHNLQPFLSCFRKYWKIIKVVILQYQKYFVVILCFTETVSGVDFST